MSCALTTGFPLDCRDSVGGIKSIMVAELSAKESLTASEGLISAITLAEGKQFYKYEFRKQTGNFTETIESSDENGTVFYSQELNIQLSKLEVAKRNEILLLAKNDLIVIVEDRNGNYWMLGEENGMVLSGTGESGTAMGDFSGYNLIFTGAEKEPASGVSDSIIAGLLVPAV